MNITCCHALLILYPPMGQPMLKHFSYSVLKFACIHCTYYRAVATPSREKPKEEEEEEVKNVIL